MLGFVLGYEYIMVKKNGYGFCYRGDYDLLGEIVSNEIIILVNI